MGFLDDLLKGAQTTASRAYDQVNPLDGGKNWNQRTPTTNTTLERLANIGNNYMQQVGEQSKYPFFNADNTPIDWATRKVPEQFRTRGVAEGVQSLTNPLLMNPYISPIAEPLFSEARGVVSRSPLNPVNNLARDILGLPQTVNKLPIHKRPFGGNEAFWNQD